MVVVVAVLLMAGGIWLSGSVVAVFFYRRWSLRVVMINATCLESPCGTAVVSYDKSATSYPFPKYGTAAAVVMLAVALLA